MPLLSIAERFWPGLKEMSGQRRLIGAGEVLTFLYSAPLALLGVLWLAFVSNWQTALQNWPMLLILAVLLFIFRKLSFFMIAEIRSGRYASTDGSMESMILWIGLLLFGPVVLWLSVGWAIIDYVSRWNRRAPIIDKWSGARNFSFYLAITTIASLAALFFYRLVGGSLPLAGLSPQEIEPALGAVLVYSLVSLLIWSGYIAYSFWMQINLAKEESTKPLLRFLFIALGLPQLALPFAILAAGVYSQNGFATFLFFCAGLVLVALLTRQMSWVAESGRQQSRLLEKLEQLGRGIINSPPDASLLPLLLTEHVPGMFPSGRISIWEASGQILLLNPSDWKFDPQQVWEWLRYQKETHAFLSKDALPWKAELDEHNAVIVLPILDVESAEAIGGIYLELFSLAQPWDNRSLRNLFPAALNLGAQVASARHQAQVYGQALAYQKVSQELILAGKIQASFLPDELPRLNGWELAVTLLPARETSGDFFDLISLSNGKLGMLIADVTDKGVGAALYMALSRTLIRTYAIEFDDDPQPDVVFFAANNRLLDDARANLFVTAFYGILDPETGIFTYTNAGHNPPYLLRGQGDRQVVALGQTGVPIGIEEDTLWQHAIVQFEPGDVLVLYTDGIPDAQNEQGDFFEDRMLLEIVHDCRGLSAQEVQEKILRELGSFVGSAAQYDDITLMVLARDLEVEPIEVADEMPERSSEG